MNHPTSLPRRRFLRGLGTMIALPMFESLLPSRLWAADAVGADKIFPRRLVYTYAPNGKDMARWTPATTGPGYEMGYIMQPLKSFKDKILVVSGLNQHNGDARSDGGGDHARANSTYLTGARPNKSQTEIHLGISADQIAANKIGQQTKLPSLQISSDRGPHAGKCDDAYACSYQYNLSWANDNTPMLPEVEPRAVFERLFGDNSDSASPEVKAKRQIYNQSVLDYVTDDAKRLQNTLGYSDRNKLDQYLTSVREVERRLTLAGTLPSGGQKPREVAGPGATDAANFDEFAKIMFDLQVVALQSDLTRVITFAYGKDGQNRAYPDLLGITTGHHDLSHHRDLQTMKDQIAQINYYHVSLFAYFLNKLQAVPEGNRTLLDNCMVVYGSSLSDGNRHDHFDLPVLVAGSGGGALTTGTHIDFAKHNTDGVPSANDSPASSRLLKSVGQPLNNLHLTLLDQVGAGEGLTGFGDSTGRLSQILAKV